MTRFGGGQQPAASSQRHGRRSLAATGRRLRTPKASIGFSAAAENIY